MILIQCNLLFSRLPPPHYLFRAEGSPTPKMNGDAVDDDDDDDNDCDDALNGPGPSQAAHLLSWLELRALHMPHFHDSAGSA